MYFILHQQQYMQQYSLKSYSGEIFQIQMSQLHIYIVYYSTHTHTHTHLVFMDWIYVCLSASIEKERKWERKRLQFDVFFFLFYYFDGTKSDYTTRINYGLAFSFTSMEFFCFCASFRSYYVFDSNQKNTNLSVNYWIWSDQNS